jgi:hypothetical protein
LSYSYCSQNPGVFVTIDDRNSAARERPHRVRRADEDNVEVGHVQED